MTSVIDVNVLAQRQAILDYLNEFGEAPAARISGYIQRPKRTVQAHLLAMRDAGEVASIERMIGTAMTPIYRAKVTTTRMSVPTDEVTTSPRPGHIIHRGTDRDHPIKNHGGQGAIGVRPHRNSIMERIA